MDFKKIGSSKDVLIASAIGATLGALSGKNTDSAIGSVVFGAGVGALVGLLGSGVMDTFKADSGKADPEGSAGDEKPKEPVVLDESAGDNADKR
ncbi:MAG: hypothetical protein ACI93R_001297 [Flavobacteriales bacterium]|jgi:hypothetical protein